MSFILHTSQTASYFSYVPSVKSSEMKMEKKGKINVYIKKGFLFQQKNQPVKKSTCKSTTFWL